MIPDITYPRGLRAIRETAEAMTPLDAVNYLLGVLEAVSEAARTDSHPTDEWGDLTLTQRRILRRLYDANGAIVTQDRLMMAAYFDRSDDQPTNQTLAQHISRMRKRLPEGVTISAVYGQGWRLVR